MRNWVNYHPITMGQLWNKAMEAASDLVEHPRFFLIRFEDLATDSESGMRDVCSFLGVPFQSEMLDVPRWGSSNVQHSSELQGVSTEVVDQWKKSLPRGEVLLCEKMTHRVMEQFGYMPESFGDVRTLSAVPSLLKYPLHVAGVIAMNPGRALIQLAALGHSRRANSSSK